VVVINWSVCPWQAFPAKWVIPRAFPRLENLKYEGSGLTPKCKARLERLARDEHCRLSKTLINYGCTKFYNIGSRSQ
jgi:hypothetical protein